MYILPHKSPMALSYIWLQHFILFFRYTTNHFLTLFLCQNDRKSGTFAHKYSVTLCQRSLGTPYLIPVDVCVARVLGFGGLLSKRCRISAPVDLIGRTQVWDKEELTIYDPFDLAQDRFTIDYFLSPCPSW